MKKDVTMDEESQRFMAFSGLRAWCVTALKQIERMNLAMKERNDDSPSFNCEKHLFLISAWKVVEHVDWVKRLNFVDADKLTDFGAMREPLKAMRDKNEHVIKYFRSEGGIPTIGGPPCRTGAFAMQAQQSALLSADGRTGPSSKKTSRKCSLRFRSITIPDETVGPGCLFPESRP